MNKIMNVTSISEIMYFESHQEWEEYNNSASYDEYRLSIIKTADSIGKYLEVYYGSRRLTDILVVNSYPNSDEYPLNKIYIYVNKENLEEPEYRGFYYKYIDKDGLVQVATIDLPYIRYVIRDFNKSLMTWLWDNGEEDTVVVLTDDDKVPDSIVDPFVDAVSKTLKDDYDYTLRWGKIK